MNGIQPVLKQLFAAYPNSEASEATVAVYLRALSDIPVEGLQQVIDRAIAESRFLPTISELRSAWDQVAHSPEWLDTRRDEVALPPPPTIGWTVRSGGEWEPLYGPIYVISS